MHHSDERVFNRMKPKPPPPPDSGNTEWIAEWVAHCQQSTAVCRVKNPDGSANQCVDPSACCTKVDFFKLLKPKRCKHSKNNPSCCPFSKDGIKYPICSWFASPKYYHHTCSRSTRPQCCRTKCWFHDDMQLCRGEEGGGENGEDGQQQKPRRRISSNTLHGVKSVNDLRAWSICCDEQRKYFLEQMLKEGKRLSGEEGELEMEMDEDAPSDATPMERKYESLLRGKEEEIARLKERIRELEGQPGRPLPSSMRSVPGESKSEIVSKSGPSSRGASRVPSGTEAGGKSSAGGILSKSKSTTKLVTIEDSPPTKASKTSIFSEKSIPSMSSIAAGESQKASATSVGGVSEAGSRRESLTKTQKSGTSLKSSPSGTSAKASEAKSQKSSQNVSSDSAMASRKGSDAKTRRASSDSIRSGTVSPKGSQAKTQKSSGSMPSDSAAPSRKGSDTSGTRSQQPAESVKSQKSALSEKASTPETVAQKSSETVPPQEGEEDEETGTVGSVQPSEVQSQKSVASPKSEKSSPESKAASETTVQKSSESILPPEEEGTAASELQSQKSAGSVKSEKSSPVSKVESNFTSQKSSESIPPEEEQEPETSKQPSEMISQKSVGSVKSGPSEATSQKSVKNVASKQDVEVASKKPSSVKSQKSSADEDVAEEDQADEAAAVSGKPSATTSQKSGESVTKSSPASRKESDVKSAKSQLSTGSVKSSKSTPSAQEVAETEVSAVASKKSSAASQQADEPTAEEKILEDELLQEERKDSGLGSREGSKSSIISRRSSPQTQATIPEESEEQLAAESEEAGVAKSQPESAPVSKPVSQTTSAHSQRSVKDDEEEPDLFEDEPPDEISLDDIHPVTSSEELSEELYFIDPETEGVEVTYEKGDESPEEGELPTELPSEITEEPEVEPSENADEGQLAEVARSAPEEQPSQDAFGAGEGPKPLAEQDEDDLLGDILPLQSNESLCMELSFVEKPKDETSTQVSEKSMPKEPRALPQEQKRPRGMSLAEIGGFEERRKKPFTCGVCEEEKPKFPRTKAKRTAEIPLAHVQLGYDSPYNTTRVVVENNRILKMQGWQVVEELDPEALVVESELLKDRLVVQNERIRELEESLYCRYPPPQPQPNAVEQNQIAILREQVLALEAELAERENVVAQWYSELEMAIQERDVYREESIRNQAVMQDYEMTVERLQQRLLAYENARAGQIQQQPQPQQRQQPQPQPNYPNYYPGGGGGGGRGDHPNHIVCIRR